jgi:hypothetical protein
MNHRKPIRYGNRCIRLATTLAVVLGLHMPNSSADGPAVRRTPATRSQPVRTRGTSEATQPAAAPRPTSQNVERVTWRAVAPQAKEAVPRVQSGSPNPVKVTQHSTLDAGIVEHGDWYEEPIVAGDEISHPLHNANGGCDCEACCPEVACGPTSRGPVGFWIRGEYVSWSLDAMDLPPLVTTSTTATTPDNTGILNRAGTEVLFGDDSINDSFRSGGRITLGWFENQSRAVGYELSYLGIASDGDDFATTSAETPRIARPVFDTGLGAESSQLVAHPAFLSGSISIETDSDLQFVELIRRQRYSWSRCHQLDFLVGYRHGRLDESIRIEQSSRYTAAQGQILAGTTVDAFDLFSTENRFHGAQFGIDYQQINGCWTLAGMAKIGLGIGSASVDIDGRTVNTVPNSGSATFEGGLLAQTTNMGNYDESDFVVIPEVGLRLTNQINRCTQLSIGYSFVYWSKIARAADQIDRNVSQFPPEPASGDLRPRFAFETDSFIAHGVNAGLQYRF